MNNILFCYPLIERTSEVTGMHIMYFYIRMIEYKYSQTTIHDVILRASVFHFQKIRSSIQAKIIKIKKQNY